MTAEFTTIYDALSTQRKKDQENGVLPKWYSTGGYQLFTQKYLYEAKDFKEQARRIATTAAKHMPSDNQNWADKFFTLIWNGWLSCSTPVLSNTGTDRGLPVSCAGGYVSDSIDGFYSALHEQAILSQTGHGTSVYLGDIRPRGTSFSGGGKASGLMPVLEDFMTMATKVSQGGVRRGAIASYLPMSHGDFWEVIGKLESQPDDMNIGWAVYDKDIDLLNAKDTETINRYQQIMKVKMVTGRGYIVFPDKINRNRPEMYINRGLDVKASNLCNEINLHSSEEYTFTCVLSSMNLSKWDEWKNTDAVFNATVFLDCIAEEYIHRASKYKGLEKAVAFTKAGRALGLGACGFHSYLQDHMMDFDSFETHNWNNLVFKHMATESLRASQYMAKELGEPEWCKGYGVRNTHRIAIAPTKSTSVLMGGVSEGINPDPAMVFTQSGAAGELQRINPSLLKLMKERDKFARRYIQEIIDDRGSVQNVSWLSDAEKRVFRTAFELDQRVVLRLASSRAKWIDQWQSLNLFFSADEDESYISQVHKEAFLDENIRGLYYVYSMSNVVASKDTECIACQ